MRPFPILIGVLLVLPLAPRTMSAQVRVNPTGVNVNAHGATTVFLTYGGLAGYAAAEAHWCGALLPAAPDIGLRCDPATLFGALPPRLTLARASGTAGLTDIMSIPPSVARRAYDAAAAGQTSSFFYVRRFVSLDGGPDQFVAVTCRLTGGGARTAFAITHVNLAFMVEAPVLFAGAGDPLPPLTADIAYNGTGVLRGRWELVLPGDEMPEAFDLLTEAALPAELRGTQRRYREIGRFNVFLPPTGRVMLDGPDPTRLPTEVAGTYAVLLRIEASDDKEGDSSLSAVGAGTQVVHSGAVAGFALPMLRYVVGSRGSELTAEQTPPTLRLLLPAEAAPIETGSLLEFSWMTLPRAAYYRLTIETRDGTPVHAAIVEAGTSHYRAPPWVGQQDGRLRWQVSALDRSGRDIGRSAWRRLGPDRQ
jgi:hypothetical protein